MRRHLPKILAAVGVACAAVTLAGCQAAAEPVPSDDHATDIAVTVYVGDNFYEPTSVTIAPGQAVEWEWVGRDQHDVVSDDRSFVTELQSEGKYVHIFEEVGTYDYLCSIHPEMRGVVVVE